MKFFCLFLSAILLSACASSDQKTNLTGEESVDSMIIDLRETLLALKKEERVQEWRGKVEEIVEMSAVDLARAIANKELYSEEVLTAFLEQILRANQEFNAVVTLDAKGALAKARAADLAIEKGENWGPLHGVPFTIKDTYRSQGMRTTAGYLPLKEYIPEENAVVVQRLINAGAILMGKTNTPTLAMDMQTTNPLFGVTGNRFNPAWTAGGSSGGASVAVALRMTPFDFGTDLAGSIRLPAAFNGVYGLRPTHGLVSMRGHIPPLPTEIDGIKRMAVAGPIAHSLGDLEFLLKIVAGPGEGDYRLSPLPPLQKNVEARDLKIAWASEFGDVPVAREVRDAIQAFAEKVARHGVHIQKDQPKEFPYVKAWETWGAFVGLQGGYDKSNFTRSLGDFFTKSAVKDTPMQRKIVGPISVPGYMEALKAQDECMDQLESFLEAYDVYMVPVSSTTAFPHFAPTRTFGDFNVYDNPMEVDQKKVPYYVATQSYTTVFSLTESPVVVIQIGIDKKGAPIGIQLVGHRYRDLELLEVAKILDKLAKAE